MNDLVIYQNGEIELKVEIKDENIWLTQKQIAELFDVKIPAISKHVKNIFIQNELNELSTVSKMETVQKEGNRNITRTLEFYNLDMIISIGYRVNSIKATNFRQWATKVLKSYITDGYTINAEKITNQRFKELENDVTILKSQVNSISGGLEDSSLKPKQKIFYDGQTFDAYIFVADIIKRAKVSIKLIDNYIDESVLTLFSKNQNIKVTLYTKTISKQLKLDVEKYNSQYNNIEIKKFNASHDRFLIIDEKEVYHIGASLKDLGKKWFGFSKMDSESFKMMGRLK